MSTMLATNERTAAVRKGRFTTRREVAAYLPHNYTILDETDEHFIIGGHDVAGWTLDGYVLPRLASGCLFGEEIVAESD